MRLQLYDLTGAEPDFSCFLECVRALFGDARRRSGGRYAI
jgi:hypothetical protein